MGRIIGIRHRRKRTAENEARPTQVAIVNEGKVKTYDLPDDQAEFDFVWGQFPIRHRNITPEDQISDFRPHQLKWRKLEDNEDPGSFPAERLEKRGRKFYTVAKVPSEFEGLRADDTVAMTLGGSGDMLAYALTRRAEVIDATVLRLPPFQLQAERGEVCKDQDAVLIARLAAKKPELFYPSQPRDEKVILVRELYRQRITAMKSRIACEQRLRQVFVGKIFADGTPEVEIEKRFEEEKANDQILQNMLALENDANKRLTAAIEDLDVYNQVFAPLKGVGPQTAARVIAGVVDIRRFPTRDKFVAFCGVSSTADGKFRRFRRGEKGGCGNPAVRQGLWLIIADQANKRPDSEWGRKLREVKTGLREKHPVPIETNGKKRYTDGHIHKMAIWKTATKLARQIHSEWMKVETESAAG